MRTRQLMLALLVGGVGLAACENGGRSSGDTKPFTGKPFTLTVEPPAAGKVDTQLSASVRVVPRGPYKINLEYPHKLTWTGPEAATPRSGSLKAKQAAAMKKSVLMFRPSFRVGASGDYPFVGTLRFSVCTEKQCEMKSEKVRWVARVEQ